MTKTSGLVIGARLHFDPALPLTTAHEQLRRLLPTDTVDKWAGTYERCQSVSASSAQLAALFSDRAIGDPSGTVLLTLWTTTPSSVDLPLDPDHVTDASISAVDLPQPTTPDGGC